MFVGTAGKAEDPAQTLLGMAKVTQQNRSINLSQTRCKTKKIFQSMSQEEGKSVLETRDRRNPCSRGSWIRSEKPRHNEHAACVKAGEQQRKRRSITAGGGKRRVREKYSICSPILPLKVAKNYCENTHINFAIKCLLQLLQPTDIARSGRREKEVSVCYDVQIPKVFQKNCTTVNISKHLKQFSQEQPQQTSLCCLTAS